MTTDDAGDSGDRKVTLGAVLDGLIGSMTKDQFDALAERTGHAPVDPKQKATEALSQLIQKDNLAADGATVGEMIRKLRRHGRGRG